MKAGKFPLAYPTAGFGALLFILGAMWYAASSQNSPAIYLLLFALVSVFLVSIPHTLINLAGVTLRVESAKPTFAGDDVCLPVEIINSSRAKRYGIELILPDMNKTRERIDCIPRESAARVTVRFPAIRRGEHPINALDLTTCYPLGFMQAWKRFAPKQTYLVYPMPAGNPQLPISNSRFADSWTQQDTGPGDDFAGIRAYMRGESQRHIDWKAVARGQPLMTKQFAAETRGAVYLDFFALNFADVEQRLSQLTLWVIEAERARQPYGLRLPGIEISPTVGQSHFHHCLRALSLFRPTGHDHE
ncbi:MAG: DUF58 domain-containing protein [Alphaproteobacteria bacterium]